ncbi:efflux transporter outer membrane subunit [Usitatibacter palustris]|uniref:Toluene efflux pump outer membrane protein TtgI n=1 Tax=Usitatibacter palustris TaxID=2732487 RepID=A0A6M4H8B2_9PROT|nr:efflux transporter outer membrane subunit [Usitatibacter palustris]QJR15939.1 Toluene efflux pump outer membrane protein TtgI [Usitatibacter palustris]
MRRLLPAVIALSLAACAPNYVLPPTTVPLTSLEPGRVQIVRDWWKGFNEPVLDALIAEAFASSPTLEVALARVDASRARLGISGSERLPSVDGQVGAGRARLSEETNPLTGGRTTTVYNASLVVNWEVDLWGRIRNQVAASESDLLASEYGRDAITLGLAAEVANAYFQLRSLESQQEIARRTVESRAASYDLRVKRFARGITSELDVRQAESELAIARAALPDLAEAIVRVEAALALAIGRSPESLYSRRFPQGKEIEAIPLPPTIPEGLPSDLLLRRPDIQESEAQLRATQARIAGARTAYFPVIGLTGAYGGESLAFDNLFSGPARAWSFAGSLAAPIFNSGRTAAQVDLATADERAALASYRSNVIRAFGEVRTALIATRVAGDRVSARDQSVVALRRQLYLATLRYDNGYSSYLDLLDAERSLFTAELQAVDARRQQLAAVVDLYRALGGGWKLPAEGSSTDKP